MARMYHPPAPSIASNTGDVQMRLAQLADQISQKADLTTRPSYDSILLRDSTGASWRLTVDSSGALHTDRVTRP